MLERELRETESQDFSVLKVIQKAVREHLETHDQKMKHAVEDLAAARAALRQQGDLRVFSGFPSGEFSVVMQVNEPASDESSIRIGFPAAWR